MVEIVDHRGEPIRREAIAEPQTARVGQLPETIGLHPSRGLTPSKLARVLEEAEQGDLQAQLDLFEDMEEKDGHIFAELSKRRRALLGLEWSIEPPRDADRAEERATDLVRELVQDLDIEEIILEMGDAIGKGFACLELDWALEERAWRIESLDLRPQRWFRVSTGADETITLRNASADGERLTPFGWVVHQHKARSGHLARAALGRILAWPFLFKNYSVRDLAEFLEIYGLPLRLGTYPPGASDREKATLLRAVLSIGHAAAGIVPEGMQVDFKEAAKGQSDPFMAMIDWCERTVSKAVLGATLTSQADRGSNTNALGNVHNEVRRDLMVSDARQVAATITRDILYPLAALNSGGIRSVRRAPRWVFNTQEAEDLKLYADAIPKLVRVGVKIPERWPNERLQIPVPEDGEPVLAMPQQQPTVPLRSQSGSALAALRGPAGEDATPGQQTQQLGQQAEATIEQWVSRVEQLLGEVDSLTEFADRLTELYPELDSSELESLMGQALTAAELAGRYDLLQEL